jgi:peptidoglycan/xylan/chitin deacetylase (PgdA/CDA1 family)
MRKFKLLLYYLCSRAGLFYLAQWLTRKRLRILCYHGLALADEAAFRAPMFIERDQFTRRLEALRRYGFRVLSLGEAVAALYSGTLPSRAVVITADDGFYSFFSVAVPCLKSYGFPATVYLTTYYVQHSNPVFRLVVQYMFWKTRKRAVVLKGIAWGDDQNLDLTNREQVDRVMWGCINYGERHCTEEMRCSICEELGTLLETSYSEIVKSKILTLMTPDEVRLLAAANIDVQLHTHRHTLPDDDEIAVKREIEENRAAIQQMTAAEARHFCYPSGLWHPRQWAWLEAMRVESSTTCIPGLNSSATPRQALRRFVDGEHVHQLEFEAHLTGFVSLLRGFIPAVGVHAKRNASRAPSASPD